MVLLALMTSITMQMLSSLAGVYSLIERVVSTAIIISASISPTPYFRLCPEMAAETGDARPAASHGRQAKITAGLMLLDGNIFELLTGFFERHLDRNALYAGGPQEAD
jgi:hypothetical protein